MSTEGFILKFLMARWTKKANKLLDERKNKGSSWKRRVFVEKIQNTLSTLAVGQKTVRSL